MSIESLVAGGALTLIGLFVGSYLRPYLARKGENLATHEDIKKLVDQVKAVTRTAEEIKAEISTGVWDKQKRWEMKREVLFDAARRLSEMDDAMLSFASMLQLDQTKQQGWSTVSSSSTEQAAWLEIKSKSLARWKKASTAFDESKLFVGIVCGKDGKQSFEDLGNL